MLTPETLVASVTLLALGLMLVLALLRWRLKEPLIFHLGLYTGLAFFSNLFILMALLELDIALAAFRYDLATEFTLLAMILSFGALTLSFLRKRRRFLIGYWVLALVILSAWGALAVNFQGWAIRIIDFLAGVDVKLDSVEQLTLIVAGLGWLAAITTVLAILTRGFRKRQTTQHLNRLRYWLIVTTVLSATGLSLFANPATFNLAGLSLLAAATIVTGYTVLSYHTPDLKLLVGWGFHHLGLTVILSGLTLLGFVGAIQLYLRLAETTNPWLWLAILAVVLAHAYRPLIRLANQFLTTLIFGKTRRDERQMIKRYNQSISSSLDVQRLSNITADLMLETLNIDRSVVFVNQRERSGQTSLRSVAAAGLPSLTPRYFTADNPFVSYFLEKKTLLPQYDVDVRPEFRGLSQEEQQWLAALGIELYVPVLRNQELLAVLAFGPKAQGTAYNQEEQDLMLALADQAGLALEGALLFQELKMVNEEVGILTDRLSVLDQSKADFLSIASHELRTPLTQIHTYSQLLLEFTEEDLKDEDYVKQVFEGIAKGSERMKEVVDLMLDISAADLGIMHLFKGPVSLKEVYEQAVHPFLPVLDERRLRLTETGLAALPIVEADGTRLVQVLENLIGNAIKYTPDRGSIKVQGRAFVDDKMGPVVEITVSDTGIGIDPEHHHMIFEKFFRVDDSRFHSTSKIKFKGAGPGLGLTLVKAVVEAHRGRVWVESSGYDETTFPGSTFYVLIPVVQAKLGEQVRDRAEIQAQLN
jgi:signal transduction histidine kinase